MDAERIIIGESQHAGLPVSAPVTHDDHAWFGAMRWRHNGNSFSLEHCGQDGKWREVPCFVAQKNEKVVDAAAGKA